MSQTYSLLRSKTFWTLMLMFGLDALSVYGNIMPPNMLMLANLVLTTVASYFHLQTGRSDAGAN